MQGGEDRSHVILIGIEENTHAPRTDFLQKGETEWGGGDPTSSVVNTRKHKARKPQARSILCNRKE